MSITSRIDRITLVPPHASTALPAPKSVKIELTSRCNYRCSFCSLKNREKQTNADMDLDFFKRITQEMRDAGVEEIGTFYIGESTTNPDLLVAAIKHCKDIGFPYVFLTTNGSLLTPELAERVMEAGLDSLKFSINAASPEQFKEIMRVKVKLFDNALDNLKMARAIRDAKGYKTKIYASSIQYDGEQGERMKALLAEKVLPYVDEAYQLPLYQMGINADEVEKTTGYRPTHGNSGRIDKETGKPNRTPIPCWSAFNEGHVRVDGHFSMCCFGSDDRFDVGDLNTDSFMQIWNNEKMVSVRAAHIRARTEGVKALKGTMCEVCVLSE